MKSYRSPKLEVRSSAIHGRGAFAAAPFRSGELVAVRGGSVLPYIEARLRDARVGGFSMQVEPGLFLCPDTLADIDELAVFLNHSCDPNVGISGQISFVAMRDIAPGEELTFDYAMNVSFPYEIDCQCGAALCRKRITGEDWKDEALRTKYAGYWDWPISHAGEPGEPPRLTGPVLKRIKYALRGFAPFDAFEAGSITRNTYVSQLDDILALPPSVPLNANQRALSARLHFRRADFVERTLEDAITAGVLSSTDLVHDPFDPVAERLDSAWNHGPYSTFIFPEEAHLLYCLARAEGPRRIIALGSYYGYWAAWAILGAGDSLEKAVLVDSDAAVCALASENLTRLGLADRTEIVCAEGTKYLSTVDDEFDFVVLDAEGPRDAGPPRFRGKNVYGPLAEAVLARAREGSLLVAHNILLDEMVQHAYFREHVDRNRGELAEFLSLMASRDAPHCVATSTEGVGVYRL